MLGWSINLFKVFGIRLAVHGSFFLLLAWRALQGWELGGLPGMVWEAGLITAFFACVVLHELGHSLTARRYGVNTGRILLMPIGGMAEMDRIPRKPSAELLITIAGPAVNFAIAAALAPFFWRYFWSDVEVAEFGAISLGFNLLFANLLMGVFNLLPVFPMDGGRILRALLATRLPYLRASWWAASIGKVLALVFAACAAWFFHAWLLTALFVFIYFAADAEYKMLLRREQEALYYADLLRQASAWKPVGEDPRDPPVIIVPNGPN